MLNPDDRRAIEGLFSRITEVERKSPRRDGEAEDLINREIARQPAAPYYMAQTILVQEHALDVAQRRIEDLEAQVAQRERGGLFGGLFDDGRGRQNRPASPQQPVQQSRGPWDRQDDGRGQGGGFLATAASTALGVAGGVLLGSAIGSLFGAGGAHAAEAPTNDQPDSGNGQQDQGADDAESGGDDFGGDGGFDMGGDF